MSKIRSLYVRNFVGIKELDVDVSEKVNKIKGKNGSGKSSTINAIADLFDSAEVVTILRTGEKTGELVAMLDDGTKIGKGFDADEEKTQITETVRGKIPQNETKKRLKKLTNAFALRPLAFLTCDDKERAKVLLASMPIVVPETSIATLTKAGVDCRLLAVTQDKLGWLNGKRKEIETERRDINRNLKELTIHTAKLDETIPKKSGDDIKDELILAEAALGILSEEFATHKGNLDTREIKLIDAAKNVREQERIHIEQGYKEHLARANRDFEMSFSIITAEAKELLLATENKFSPQIDQAKAEVTELKTKNEAHIGYEKLKEEIASQKIKLETIKAASTKLTYQLDYIDTVKSKILEKLPIKKVDVIDGIVYIDKHPWPDVNTARRVEIGFELALSMMGELRTILIDDAEHLDADTTAEIEKQADKKDVQLFFASVANVPFEFSAN